MPAVPCSHTGCTYTTGDVDKDIVVELLKIHALTHVTAAPQQPTVDAHRQKPPKLTRPTNPKESLRKNGAQSVVNGTSLKTALPFLRSSSPLSSGNVATRN